MAFNKFSVNVDIEARSILGLIERNDIAFGINQQTLLESRRFVKLQRATAGQSLVRLSNHHFSCTIQLRRQLKGFGEKELDMPTRFPGMDPYLERPGLWSQVHTNLIVDIQRFLARRLRPYYQVSIEQRTHLALFGGSELIGEPDVLVISPVGAPTRRPLQTGSAIATSNAYVVDLPMPDNTMERYLEVRDVETGEAITVIEILSPSNKMEDRARYERKRLQILRSMTNLVEIDLLRSGKPLPMVGKTPPSHYRILISREWQRPKAEVLLFNVRDSIPDAPIPLRQGESEPALPLNQILHDLYDQASYDLFIDYQQPPVPPLEDKDAAWASALLPQAR